MLKTMYFQVYRESNFTLDYRVQRCQITENFFLYKSVGTVNDILVGLERILDYRLERLNSNFIFVTASVNVSNKNQAFTHKPF